MSEPETIYALSTPYARSGVAIVRLSGKASRSALALLGVDPLPAPRTASLRKLLHPQTQELIDEAIVLFFPSPHSFTGEDVAELHIHGSLAVIKELLGLLSAVPGLRPAEAGEFARRAFLNGRMDLTAIEGLGDLIESETVEQKRQAQKIMGGAMAQHYDALRAQAVRTLALLEAYIDFPDEDIPPQVFVDVFTTLAQLQTSLVNILEQSRSHERIRSGFSAVILGAPNAGKSSLLNALAKRDVAMTSSTAGTTRDMIEVHLDIGGFAVVLVDTAGLRDAQDDIEREGIRRALQRAANADLKLVLLDINELTSPDAESLGQLDKNSILLISKCDEGVRAIPPGLESYNATLISARTGEGIKELLQKIESFIRQSSAAADQPIVITRERHRIALQNALGALIGIRKDQPIEIICEQIRQSANHIGKITGRIMVDELLGEIFSSFCIGK